MPHAIQARNLCKTFPGGTVAVNALDLEVPPGTVYGLIGRNGAGKTTTLRLLMGLLQSDAGEAAILGQDMWSAPREIRSRVAYVSQSQQLPGWMSVRELERCVRGFYPAWDEELFSELIKRWDLPAGRPVATLSGGEQRKCSILLALCATPEVLLLDEPAGGLDPLSRRELINELVSLLARAPGATILFSTHYISDLERVADRVGVLDRGRLIMDRSLEDLHSCYRRVQVIFPGDSAPPRFSIPGARRTSVSGPVVSGVTEYFDAEHLNALDRWPGVRVQLFPLNLEDIFLELTAVVESSNRPEMGPEREPCHETDNLICL